MKRHKKELYVFAFLPLNLLCIVLMLFTVTQKRIDTARGLESERERLRISEERLALYEASNDFDDLAFNITELERKIQPAENIPESVVALCLLLEDSGFELTGCFAGRAEKMEESGAMKQTVSLSGRGAAARVYDFIESIENSPVLYRVESLDVTAENENSETNIAKDIALDIKVALFVRENQDYE